MRARFRRIHPRNRAKSHWVFDLKATRELYGVSRNTPLNWITQGLRPIDDRKPIAFRGDELNRFHRMRWLNSRRPLQPGELFCFRCRRPKQPKDNVIDFIPYRAGTGQIIATCPDCGNLMFRFVGSRDLARYAEKFQVNTKDDGEHYSEPALASALVHSTIGGSQIG